jgi:hypothetical protein
MALASVAYRQEEYEDYDQIEYRPVTTIDAFHLHPGQIRGIVGPVGSGKTTGATWDVCRYLPLHLAKNWGFLRTKWVVVRNTYDELIDTTQATVFEWFGWGSYRAQRKIYNLFHEEHGGFEVEILFRSCDRIQDLKKFKSLEVTGYWIDESIEVAGDIKRILKTRIGRYPSAKQAEKWYKKKFGSVPPELYELKRLPDGTDEQQFKTPRFGLETTNPPDVEHETYHEFNWQTEVPGPISEKQPLKNHYGFWQPPRENEANLRAGYYDDLITDYADHPDWLAMYVEGKPGIIVTGKLVYNNFKRGYHVAKGPLIWDGIPLYRGWDNSGNIPACIVVGVPAPRTIHIFKEFCHDKMNIVQFTKYVIGQCNILFGGAEFKDWGDPAGEAKYSTKDGGWTSNAILMREEGVDVQPSEQNPSARYNAVDDQLLVIDGALIDPSCVRLINGFMGGYHYPEVGAGTGIYMDKPSKNRFSHIQDALQYVMVRLVSNKKHKSKSGKWKRRNRSAMAV